MAYNTKPIVTDKNGNPISQYFNPNTDKYEPVEGSGGGNNVVLYNADGTENNELSLISILDKLSQLTGTVIDEETRKSNELLRIELYNQISQMLVDGELKGDKGDIGLGLEYDWNGTQLGVRVEGEDNYIYVDLKGPKGEKGETGSMGNLNAQQIEDALGYVPADEDIVGMLASLTTDEKANLVAAINEVRLHADYAAIEAHEHRINKVNPHGVTKAQVGLSNVPNLNMADFGLSSTLGSYSGDLKDMVTTRLFCSQDSSPTNWPSALGTYPMGIHFNRSTAVQSQLAMGYIGGMGYRVKLSNNVWSPWRVVYDKGNTIVDANGFIKEV